MLNGEPVRAITVCVEYADLLALAAPWNQFFYDELMVVTSRDDDATANLCERLSQTLPIRCHRTDVFYARKAKFNKYAAIEEGLDVMGRSGWILVIDADIAIMKTDHPFNPRVGNLYTPIRHVLENIVGLNEIPPQARWSRLRPPRRSEEFNGYFHLFHSSDPVLGSAPWHQTDWTWAGGPDTFFHKKWAESKKIRPPFRCLHLGPCFQNWCGRSTVFVDGTLPLNAEARSRESAIIRRARRDAGQGFHGDRYKGEKLVDAD